MTILTPPEIVAELDRYIIGQDQAKKAVAVALRNRWRRKQVAEPLRDEITPKNILMIGPTGCGKTEIARRLAKLANAPFLKVEATKFTEVGYVGRDVDSIVRDLVDAAVAQIKDQQRRQVGKKAEANAEERVLSALVGATATHETREKFRTMLRAGELDDREIEIEVQEASGFPTFDIPGLPGSQIGMINVGDMLGKAFGGRTKSRRMTVRASYDVLMREEAEKLLDEDAIVKLAMQLAEQDGIVFLDEVDKITARSEYKGGDVSREGVQRDLLPLLEGTTVSTKYGAVKTDHILFIASGAFHMAKPADLLPELQGRLPIRVELEALIEEDLVRILKEPETSLVRQYKALLETENVTLEFTEDGIREIAKLAAECNRHVENIGARRLHTMMEKLLEEISFTASESDGAVHVIDAAYVNQQLLELTKQNDLSKFIL